LATQSAGCEVAEQLVDTPLLLLHGTDDEILPPDTTSVVQMIAGHGDVVFLPGTGHLMTQAADDVRTRLLGWIPSRFA
jgi:pimeloyl-ACP methyl ester carboxylesterase